MAVVDIALPQMTGRTDLTGLKYEFHLVPIGAQGKGEMRCRPGSRIHSVVMCPRSSIAGAGPLMALVVLEVEQRDKAMGRSADSMPPDIKPPIRSSRRAIMIQTAENYRMSKLVGALHAMPEETFAEDEYKTYSGFEPLNIATEKA